MYLYEEYARRINFNCDFVRYQNQSIVFLKENSSFNIITISKVYGNNQPNKYRISRSFPKGDEGFLKVIDCIDVEWDDYENYILNNYKSKNNAILDPSDVFLVGWEIFVIFNDKFFSDNLSYNSIYPTIDPLICKSNRIEKINEFVELLKLEFPPSYSSWLKMQENIDNYSYWLAEIINK